MTMPPSNMTPAELWSAVTEMPRPRRVCDFPRKRPDGTPIGQFAIRALTQQEHLQATIAAEKLVRQELKDAKRDESIGYEVAYSNAVAVEQLFRSCRDANDPERPAFPSPKDMRLALTTDEIGVLYNQFLDVCAEIGPIIGALTPAESEAWIDRLIQGGETDPIPFFSSGVVTTLLRTSLARLRNSPAAPSSPGSQPDAIVTEDDEGDDSITDE